MGTNWVGEHINNNSGAVAAFVPGPLLTQASQRTYDLDSSGDRIGTSFSPQESGNLTELWCYVESYAGTWTNTDQAINFTIYRDLGGNYIPDTANVVASGTIDLTGSPTGWQGVTGLSIALTAGELYFIAFHDVDGGASDFVTLMRDCRTGGTLGDTLDTPNIAGNACYTTDSWSTGANGSYPLPFMAKVGTVFYGLPLLNFTVVTSGTYERGNKLTPPDDCVLIGWAMATDLVMDDSNGVTLKLYADGNNPGGTTIRTWTPVWDDGGATTPVPNKLIFPESEWEDLDGGTTYRFVLDYTSSLTVPRRTDPDDSWSGDAQTIGRALIGGPAQIQATEESGGAWVDYPDSTYQFMPLLVPRTAVAGSGGGMRLVGAGGLVA